MSGHLSTNEATKSASGQSQDGGSGTQGLPQAPPRRAVDPLFNLTPQRETIQKRRASVSPIKHNTSKFPAFSAATQVSNEDGSKRTRLTVDGSKVEETEQDHEALAKKSYGSLTLASVPGTVGQVDSLPRSSSGSSTSSTRTARMVLLNRPCTAPLTPGTPGFKFSVFNALLSHTDVLMNIVRYLAPRTLVYLYSVSAPFHYIVNSHFTQFILASVKLWAPNADWFYPWRCYRELCIDDPALRRPDNPKSQGFLDRKSGRVSNEWKDVTMTGTEAPCGVKAVPSFRWLKMVVYREIIAREIVAWLAVAGHPTPVAHTIKCVKVSQDMCIRTHVKQG